METLQVSVPLLRSAIRYGEVATVIVAAIIGAYLLHRHLIPIAYAAIMSWSICPVYSNPRIARTKIEDLYKYMIHHDIPFVDFQEVYALGDSLWEVMSRVSFIAHLI
uniref:Reticulon-like protein n=1 Tax=Steinernema glaseri TaxID=37863 RepID=A0A1I7Z7H6_9BILA